MGGSSQGILGVETPDSSRPGGALSSANLLAGADRPGPIGMNTPTTPPSELNAGGAVDAQKILNYASSNDGKRVGTGECFDLAAKALEGAGAKGARSYQDKELSATDDYKWGDSKTLGEAQPGDIIQFKNYRYDLIESAPGDKQPGTAFDTRPHHTAIVKSVGSDGKITVWEQNIPPGTGGVKTTELYFKSFETKDGDVTTKVTVKGSVWFYRPQPKT